MNITSYIDRLIHKYFEHNIVNQVPGIQEFLISLCDASVLFYGIEYHLEPISYRCYINAKAPSRLLRVENVLTNKIKINVIVKLIAFSLSSKSKIVKFCD